MFKKKSTGTILTMSAIVVCVCFAMLLGTTFAWFTDTASTQVNTIQSGTLRVGLYDKDGVTLENTTIAFVAPDGSELDPTTTYWEPGATYRTEAFVIKNEGKLAFDFKVADLFTNAKLNAEAVAGVTGTASLFDVISFTIYEVDANGALTNTVLAVDEEVKLLSGESKTYAIVATMSDVATNEYQDCAISNIALNITATQTPHETDSNTDQYDVNAN